MDPQETEPTATSPPSAEEVKAAADKLLRLARNPVWFGAEVTLTPVATDYSLEGFTRDH